MRGGVRALSMDGVPNRAPDPARRDTLSRLIERGRDREAVQLATGRTAPNPGGPMDPVSQLEAVGPLLVGLVAPLDEAQLAAPTACDEFDVRGVIAHMAGGATQFTAAFRGASGPAPEPPEDVQGAFAATLGGLLEAVRSPGALERTLSTPFGEMHGDTFARLVVLDGLVHGWDIATATNQAYSPPAEIVDAVTAFATQAITDDVRGSGAFGPAVEPPPDASPLERLVAFTGRRI